MSEQKPFRIAVRTEGDYANFYMAQYETMTDARLLMSVHKSIFRVRTNEDFIDMIKELMNKFLEEHGITNQEWRVEPAPEHERSGHG